MDTVEMYLSDRVLRQFGLRQGIPEVCDTVRDLHQMSRRGRPGANWPVTHRDHIQAWGSRRERVVVGDVVDGTMSYSDPYMTWYRQITVLYIGDPTRPPPDVGYRGSGSTYEMLVYLLTFTFMSN